MRQAGLSTKYRTAKTKIQNSNTNVQKYQILKAKYHSIECGGVEVPIHQSMINLLIIQNRTEFNVNQPKNLYIIYDESSTEIFCCELESRLRLSFNAVQIWCQVEHKLC